MTSTVVTVEEEERIAVDKELLVEMANTVLFEVAVSKTMPVVLGEVPTSKTMPVASVHKLGRSRL